MPVSFAVFVVAGAGSSSPANARTRRAAGGFLHPRPQREDEEEEVEELQGCDCRTRQQGQRVRSLASAAGRLPKACPEGCTRPDAQHLRAGALLLPNSTDTDTVGTEGTEQLKRALRAWLLEASANPWLDPLKEATSRGGRRLAGGCPANSLLEAMSEADTCEITAVERAERGSNAGKESGLLEFLTIGECSYVAFLIYGAILGSLSGMGPGTLAIIGIVLVCWPIAACKVCCRCCRKCCCSCCREGKEVRKIGNVKKIVILLLSLAGLGGMAALPMAGIMGDVKAGSAVANSADCASREFLRSALGDVTAIGNAASVPAGGSSAAADPDPGSNSSRLLQGASFIGIATAGQEVQTVSTAVDALATAATQAAAQDNGAADHVAESLAILRLMQDSLSGQISIGGSTCTFCQTCCGTQAGALVPQLLSQLEGTPSRVTTLSADFQEEPGSRISSLKAAVVSAGAALSLLQQSFQAGPAAALILGSDLFVDPVQEMVVMGFEFGAVPIAGIGLVFLFYSLHWCCCLRRCKIDRKDHPAPQWAACGWCGGCLGALLAALLGIVTFASAAVGSEFCIMMDTLSASDGLDRYSILLGLSGDSTQVVAARSASLACLGPAADVPSRDLFPMLGLSAPVQGLSDMAADLSSLLSFDFTPLLTQYQTLNAQAQSSATTFTPTPADATSQVYTCYTWISLAQAPTSTSCDLPTFQANMQTLAQLALQSGQDASAALGSIRQSSSVWQSTLSDMQALTAHPSLAALQSGLDCAEVFDAWQVANDQACAGLADTFSTSGFVWLLAGACGFVGAIGQYWIWRNLKDNRTLFFDEHEDMKPRGMKKLFCCFCATSVGDDLDAGKTQAEEAPKEPSEKATSRSKSTGGAKTSVASKRIAIRFFEAFEMSVEENVKAFLRDELYPSYDESFKNMAVADRMASWKALEKQKQSGGDVEVQPPGEQPTDPATLFSDYGERGPDGVPTADSEGKPLDKKKLAALKKDLALLQKPWDKWQNDKRKYEAYLLSKIRKQCLEKYAEVQYTEEVEHLRPLSPTSRTPLVVVVEEVPEDRDRAVWSDELEPVMGQKLDARVRKDKAVAKKLKGLEDRCFKSVSVHDPLMKKLMVLSDDQQLWEGIKIQAAKKPTKMKAPKEPKAPKGLVDPMDHFKSGKHDGKFGAFDDKGVPTQTADGTEIPEKKLKALKKEYDSVKDKWDKHQQAMAKYSQDLTKYEKWKEGGEEEISVSGVPEAQRSAACETAALEVLRRLLDRSVTEHAEELSVEVNQGSHDPPELAALMVKVVLEHEDKTTDPVLKVLKTVDKKKRSGMIEVGELPEVFRLLKEDELQVGTHVCFGDITYEEVDFVSSVLEKSSLAKEGQISHEDLKAYIENQDLQPSEGGHPSSLAGTLVLMRLEAWKKASSVEKLMSPRAWRLQLSGGSLGEAQAAQAQAEEPAKETNAPAEPQVEPPKEETSGKDKEKDKEKKEKKDKKEKKEKKEKK